MSKIKQNNIDYSDIPETNADFWKDAKICIPQHKQSITLRIDSDVLEWFKTLGKGYQTKINAVLKTYVERSKSI